MQPYAVWFGSSERLGFLHYHDLEDFESALEEIWTMILEHYKLSASEDGFDCLKFRPYLRVSPNFYLFFVHPSWSPGDICGTIRAKKLISYRTECMAVAIDRNRYLPGHGFHDSSLWGERLNQWRNQLEQYHLISRSK